MSTNNIIYDITSENSNAFFVKVQFVIVQTRLVNVWMLDKAPTMLVTKWS